jgi:uncharacterized phage protein (TIGR02218 family)
MSYQSVEESVSQGQVVELYEFVEGPTSYRYCTSVEPVSYLNRNFTPSPIARDRVKQAGDAFKNNLTITLPRGNAFALSYITFTPDSSTSLTIYRGHQGDNNFVVYWKGRVLGGEVTNNAIQLNCESVFTSMRRPGLRAKFEYICRHSLYSVNCGVSDALFSNVGTVADVLSGGTVLQVAAAAALPNGYFTGGFVKMGEARRFVVLHNGSDLTLSRPFNRSPLGESITVYAGCDHLRSTCNDKFNNVLNFGGFSWIPERNPFNGFSGQAVT